MLFRSGVGAGREFSSAPTQFKSDRRNWCKASWNCLVLLTRCLSILLRPRRNVATLVVVVDPVEASSTCFSRDEIPNTPRALAPGAAGREVRRGEPASSDLAKVAPECTVSAAHRLRRRSAAVGLHLSRSLSSVPSPKPDQRSSPAFRSGNAAITSTRVLQ